MNTIDTALRSQLAAKRHEIEYLERMADYGLDDDGNIDDEIERCQRDYVELLDLLEEHRRRVGVA